MCIYSILCLPRLALSALLLFLFLLFLGSVEQLSGCHALTAQIEVPGVEAGDQDLDLPELLGAETCCVAFSTGSMRPINKI